MSPVLVEVCVASVAEAITAQSCGADRIELNSALQLGGLTPSAATLKRVLNETNIDVIAMARPRAGGFCYSQDDWSTLIADCQWMVESGVHGIAFGCLTSQREIDIPRVELIRKQAGDRQLVFHRAFDLVDKWKPALDALVDAGVDRIMTSGSSPSVPSGLDQIREVIEYAGNRIEIIPAGGITPCNLAEVIAATKCGQVHGTFSSHRDDPGYADGPFRFSEVDNLRVVNPRKVCKAVNAAQNHLNSNFESEV